MSDDLISRKALIENLNRFAPEQYSALVNDLILKQPTAYDVDAVCEEINNPNNYTIMAGNRYTTIERANEIVRNGGKWE